MISKVREADVDLLAEMPLFVRQKAEMPPLEGSLYAGRVRELPNPESATETFVRMEPPGLHGSHGKRLELSTYFPLCLMRRN